jgi:hypothetical protein
MPNTLIPIQTYVLTSAASSVTFSNIPQNYTDLKIVLSTRTTYPAVNDGMNIILNGSTSNFTFRQFYGTGTSVNAQTNSGSINVGPNTSADSATASTFGNAEIYISNYTSTTAKLIDVDGVGETNGTTSYIGMNATLWNPGTNVPITSVGFISANGAYNIIAGSTFTLYGISNGVKATGGTITVSAGYAYHTFTSTGSFLPSQQIKGAEVLTIAGGGSGGEGNSGYWQVGGGGGAGGVVYNNALNLTAGTIYTATVGAGGTRVSSRHGVQGNNSQFGPLTSAIGGGYGGAMSGIGGSLGPGGNGGNGGGNEGYGVWSRSTGSQGFGGGLGVNDQDRGGAGGGGGAGGQGGDGSGTTGGNGGVGTNVYSNFAYATLTGVNGFYAGGGAGSGSASGGPNGSGGSGGGGAPGVAGTANTGSGSGGTRSGNAVANGGSGIIIVRYPVL